LKGYINVLLSVVKKKVDAVVVSVWSTEASLQFEVPTVVARIPNPKVREECWNSGHDGWLEAVAASIQPQATVAAMLNVINKLI
jgi:Trk K+ transport system NAD-binding subunit